MDMTDIRGDFSSSGTQIVSDRKNYPGNKLPQIWLPNGHPGTHGSPTYWW